MAKIRFSKDILISSKIVYIPYIYLCVSAEFGETQRYAHGRRGSLAILRKRRLTECGTTGNHYVSVFIIYCTRSCCKNFVFFEKKPFFFLLLNISKTQSVMFFTLVFQYSVRIPCFLDRFLEETAEKSPRIIVTALYSIRKSNICFPHAIYSCIIENFCLKLFFVR